MYILFKSLCVCLALWWLVGWHRLKVMRTFMRVKSVKSPLIYTRMALESLSLSGGWLVGWHRLKVMRTFMRVKSVKSPLIYTRMALGRESVPL